MGLLTPRKTYGPFEYPEFYSQWLKAVSGHWHHNEVQMGGDVLDWNLKLTESDKSVLGNTLKGFVATEIFIEDFWAAKVARWFKKFEIQGLAHTFSAQETIHAHAYNYLEEQLGIQDFDSFLKEETARNKIDRLMEVKGKSVFDIARSLAIFSAFTEGVNLFSSFAVLASFSQRNLMKGVGKIIEWSAADESLHSEVGVRLFNLLIQEYPELWNDKLKNDIIEAARLTIKLEDDFIDKAFEKGDLPNLSASDLKNYIRFRCNSKLVDLGLSVNWKGVDKEALQRMDWFSVIVGGGQIQQDFFAGKEASYSKNTVDFEGVWE